MRSIRLLICLAVFGTAIPAHAQMRVHAAIELPDASSCSKKIPASLELESVEALVGPFAKHWKRLLELSGVPAKGSQSCTATHASKLQEMPFFRFWNSSLKLRCGELELPAMGAGPSEQLANEMTAFVGAGMALQAHCDADAFRAKLAAEEQRSKRAEAATSPERCPEQLVIDAADPELGSALNRWWLQHAGVAQGEPQACVLTSTSKPKGDALSLSATLECGATRIEARTTGPDEASARESLAKELGERLQAPICGTGPHAKHPLSCASMPKKLNIKGKLATKIAEAYVGMAGEAPPLSCTVEHTVSPAANDQSLASSVATLKCGKAFTLKLAGIGTDAEAVEASLVERLVLALNARRCPID